MNNTRPGGNAFGDNKNTKYRRRSQTRRLLTTHERHLGRLGMIEEHEKPATMPLQCGLHAIGYDRTTDGAECGSRGVSAQKKAGLAEIDHYTTGDAQVYARGVQI